jgi:hypothetical protein
MSAKKLAIVSLSDLQKLVENPDKFFVRAFSVG